MCQTMSLTGAISLTERDFMLRVPKALAIQGAGSMATRKIHWWRGISSKRFRKNTVRLAKAIGLLERSSMHHFRASSHRKPSCIEPDVAILTVETGRRQKK